MGYITAADQGTTFPYGGRNTTPIYSGASDSNPYGGLTWEELDRLRKLGQGQQPGDLSSMLSDMAAAVAGNQGQPAANLLLNGWNDRLSSMSALDRGILYDKGPRAVAATVGGEDAVNQWKNRMEVLAGRQPAAQPPEALAYQAKIDARRARLANTNLAEGANLASDAQLGGAGRVLQALTNASQNQRKTQLESLGIDPTEAGPIAGLGTEAYKTYQQGRVMAEYRGAEAQQKRADKAATEAATKTAKQEAAAQKAAQATANNYTAVQTMLDAVKANPFMPLGAALQEVNKATHNYDRQLVTKAFNEYGAQNAAFSRANPKKKGFREAVGLNKPSGLGDYMKGDQAAVAAQAIMDKYFPDGAPSATPQGQPQAAATPEAGPIPMTPQQEQAFSPVLAGFAEEIKAKRKQFSDAGQVLPPWADVRDRIMSGHPGASEAQLRAIYEGK